MSSSTKERISDWLLGRVKGLSNRQMMVLLAVIVGALAGLGTYLFEMLLYGIRSALVTWLPVDQAHFLYLIYPAAGIVLATLFVKYIVKDEISEGVTRVLYAMSRRDSRIAPHNCWTSIVGGATTIGFGGSVGPEAPIVLTGAAIGSNVGKLARLNYKELTLLLCCGAGAAVAAIFKAPITGVVFVLEILMLDITASSIIPLLVSSVSATTVALVFRGFDPILSITLSSSDVFVIHQIPLYVLLGVCCGLMSYYFTSMNSKVGAFVKGVQSQYRRWALGGVVLGVLIFIFPPLYGEGYEALTALMHGNVPDLFDNSLFFRFRHVEWVALIYVTAVMFFKVIAMATTNAAGGVGGTFAPSLFVGAFMGAIVALACNTLLDWNISVVSFTLADGSNVSANLSGFESGDAQDYTVDFAQIADVDNVGIFPIRLNSLRLNLSGGKKDTAYRLEIPSIKTRYKHFNDAGVYDLTVDDADVAPVYYNLQGMRIAKPQPGTVVIVKRGARVTKEIVVE